MPRRNLYALFAVAVVSLVCYQRAHRQYGPLFDTMSEILDQIDERYVEEVPRRELFEGALSGLVGTLDEYSEYIPPNDYNDLREDLEQKFGGIGISVTFDEQTKLWKVMSPLVGTPAYRAGIRAGDTILEVDGRPIEGLGLEEVVVRLRGDPGAAVRLSVMHEGETEPADYEIVREIIKVDTVLGDTRNADGSWNFFLEGHDGLGYVRITQFGEETVAELEAALAWLSERGMRGLVLDLRNNPGGLLYSAVETCDLFVEQGSIVSTRGRGGETKETYSAEAEGTYAGFPVVVIVNRFSASASEIVAACLQDHGLADVVGERTWGKGSVQDIIELEHATSALKLTVASYWRPNGKNIHRLREAKEQDEWGVLPDPGLEVKVEGEAFEKLYIARRDRDVVRPAGGTAAAPVDPTAIERHDPQLTRAVEHLQQTLRQGAGGGE